MTDHHETYIERVCGAVADVLERAAGGTKDRLAGYVANFAFWMAEAEHCLVLVKEYDERFKRFREAQQAVVRAEGSVAFDERGGWSPPPEDVSAGSRADRKEARRKVVAAMGKFLKRCAKEGLIDEATRADAARRIG